MLNIFNLKNVIKKKILAISDFNLSDESMFSPGLLYLRYNDDLLYYKIQGGPQKCPYISLAITFTKIRKPSRFFLHSYWKFIEFFR